VASVFLTNADLDHTLGLLLLREGGRLSVAAPSGVRASLDEGLRLQAVLGAYGGIDWSLPPDEWTSLDGLGLEVRAVPLPGAEPPRYAANMPGLPGGHGVGYLFRSSGGRACGIFPDVARLDAPLLDLLASCGRVYFDGTFWDEDEMPRLGLSNRGARAMGHLPVSESLALFAGRGIPAAYLHINNTNPILRPDSDERREVERHGLRVAEDGERLTL